MNKKYNLEQTSHLKTIVFLKQLIIEYSKSKGFKYSSKKHCDSDFSDVLKFFETNKIYLSNSKLITFIIIIYNRLRHDRYHTSNHQSDQKHIDNTKQYYAYSIIKNLLLELLGENYIKILEDNLI